MVSGAIVAAYAAIIGALWGAVIHRWLIKSPVGTIGIVCLGTLMAFEWFIRIPLARLAYPESIYHLTTSSWVQVWIAAFAGGSMLGFSLYRGSSINISVRRLR